MARLKHFRGYLEDRHRRLLEIEQSLVSIQENYETFFAEISRVRESELQQLSDHIAKERGRLGELDSQIDHTKQAVEGELDAEIQDLERRIVTLAEEAEKTRGESLAAEAAIRRANTALDGSEEQLKQRGARLRARIDDHNRRIGRLGSGFGFFANFFKMRGLQKERQSIDEEQADVLARIEGLRARWGRVEQEYTAKEAGLRDRWVELRTEAAALQTKLDYLRSSRERIVARSTMERVLFELKTVANLGSEGDPPCPRCQRPNPTGTHFCAYCAQRLVDDRLDLHGSWAEIAEINHHHAIFSQGMMSCQEIIGLVRGLKTGVESFTESVDDMIASEKKYPLPKLDIEVPAKAVDYGRNIDSFGEHLKDREKRHPLVFARGVKDLIDEVFTETRIQDFFETMGQELSRQAEAQW